MISENKPSVRNVIGNEKNFSIGFIVTFNNPNTIDSSINEVKENIVMLSTAIDTKYSDNALSMMFENIFFIISILLY